MQVKCSLCGKIDEINKIHKDYAKLAKDKTISYFCELCLGRIKFQAKSEQTPPKPI